MEDPDIIENSDTTRLVPGQRQSRNRFSSTRMSETEPTSLIVRQRTISTTSYLQNAEPEEEEFEGNCCTDPR